MVQIHISIHLLSPSPLIFISCLNVTAGPVGLGYGIFEIILVILFYSTTFYFFLKAARRIRHALDLETREQDVSDLDDLTSDQTNRPSTSSLPKLDIHDPENTQVAKITTGEIANPSVDGQMEKSAGLSDVSNPSSATLLVPMPVSNVVASDIYSKEDSNSLKYRRKSPLRVITDPSSKAFRGHGVSTPVSAVPHSSQLSIEQTPIERQVSHESSLVSSPTLEELAEQLNNPVRPKPKRRTTALSTRPKLSTHTSATEIASTTGLDSWEETQSTSDNQSVIRPRMLRSFTSSSLIVLPSRASMDAIREANPFHGLSEQPAALRDPQSSSYVKWRTLLHIQRYLIASLLVWLPGFIKDISYSFAGNSVPPPVFTAIFGAIFWGNGVILSIIYFFNERDWQREDIVKQNTAKRKRSKGGFISMTPLPRKKELMAEDTPSGIAEGDVVVVELENMSDTAVITAIENP